jgi:hypothetical protein
MLETHGEMNSLSISLVEIRKPVAVMSVLVVNAAKDPQAFRMSQGNSSMLAAEQETKRHPRKDPALGAEQDRLNRLFRLYQTKSLRLQKPRE